MMNKPTLNVLGRKHNIVSVEVEVAPGETKYFFDGEHHDFMPSDNVVNLAEAIENPSNAENFIQRLENMLKETREYVVGLKMQIADIAIANNKLPFSERDDSIDSLVDEVINSVPFIEGLELSLDIAKGGRSWDVDKVVSEVPSTDE